MAKVAVVMPSFNRPALVQKAIKGVKDQTLEDWNLYIMDNSSPNLWPRMQNIYQSYAENDSRIKVDHTDVKSGKRYNKWYCAVVTNKALFELSEEEPYIVLTTDDTIMEPNKLEVLTKFLETHPKIMMVTGAMQMFHPDGSLWTRLAVVGPCKDISNKIGWQQPMYRRELIDKIGAIQTKMERKPLDMTVWSRASEFIDYVYGLDIDLDTSFTYTYSTRFINKWRARAAKGEVME